MPDIRLVPVETADIVSLDWLQSPITGLLDETAELKSAVIVALCSDALASESDVLPDPNSTDRRGWWGDIDAAEIWNGWPLGSKLWLLTRAKILGSGSREAPTTLRVQNYISQAMQPFVTAQIISKFTVVVTQTGAQRLSSTVTLYRGPKTAIALQFQAVWDELLQGSSPTLAPTIST
jgi:phage gp46-like protein